MGKKHSESNKPLWQEIADNAKRCPSEKEIKITSRVITSQEEFEKAMKRIGAVYGLDDD